MQSEMVAFLFCERVFIDKKAMKYLKGFNNHSEYEAYITSENKVLPNVSICVEEYDVHYMPLTCTPSTTYELVGEPSYPSEIEGSVSSFEMSFNYRRIDIDGKCGETITEGSDTVTVNIGYNPGATRVIENTYNYNGLAVPYSITQTKLDAKVTAKFNTTSASSRKQILSSTTSVYSIEIDGVVQPSVTTGYTFDTAGEHTVVYTLNSPSLGNNTFARCGFSDVVIGSGVTSIGNNAFEYCWGNNILTSCTIGDNVETIGSETFFGCYNLSSINIPDSVTSIGNDAFCSCSGLTSITVDNSNTVYDSRNDCNAIIETATNTLVRGCKNTVIPNTVTSIGNKAFDYCTNLTSISIPDNVTSIGNGAFSVCSGMTSCTIGSGVTTIGESAFSTCRSLKSIIIPDSVTIINKDAFEQCKSLSSCTIGSGVTTIGYGAFTQAGLKDIIIPNNVTTIDNWAFAQCGSLKSVYIGSGVTSIGDWGFGKPYVLTSITVDNSNTVYDSRNGCNAIIETATNTLVQGCKTTVIPNTVTSIGQRAFESCTGITSFTIPDNVISIGNYAFESCFNMTRCAIGSGVTSIGGLAFYNCLVLASITSNATTAPTVAWSTFREVASNGTLTVPIGSTGYDVWMSSDNYYLGKYNWKKVEQ